MPSTYTTPAMPLARPTLNRHAATTAVERMEAQRIATEAQRRRRRLQATKGENIRSLMRAPQGQHA